MKIHRNQFSRSADLRSGTVRDLVNAPGRRPALRGSVERKRGEGGFAVLIFITLLAIMMILVAANSQALFNLHRDVKLLEQRQTERLNNSQTNTVATTTSPAGAETK